MIARLKQRMADKREARRIRGEKRRQMLDPGGIVEQHECNRRSTQGLIEVAARLKQVVEDDERAWPYLPVPGFSGEGRLRAALELIHAEVREHINPAFWHQAGLDIDRPI